MLLYGAMVGDGWAAESHMGGLAPSVSLAISCTCEEMLKFYEEAFNRLIKTGVSAQAWAGKSGAFIRRCTKVTPSGEVINRLPQVMVRGCSSLCMHVLLRAMEAEFAYLDATEHPLTLNSKKSYRIREAHRRVTTSGVGCMGLPYIGRPKSSAAARFEELREQAHVDAFGRTSGFLRDTRTEIMVEIEAEVFDRAAAVRQGDRRKTPLVRCTLGVAAHA
jgi:hypothetical protein